MITLRNLSNSHRILWSKPIHPILPEKQNILIACIRTIPALLKAYLPYALVQGDRTSDFLLLLVFPTQEAIHNAKDEILKLCQLESTYLPSLNAAAITLDRVPPLLEGTNTILYKAH